MCFTHLTHSVSSSVLFCAPAVSGHTLTSGKGLNSTVVWYLGVSIKKGNHLFFLPHFKLGPQLSAESSTELSSSVCLNVKIFPKSQMYSFGSVFYSFMKQQLTCDKNHQCMVQFEPI